MIAVCEWSTIAVMRNLTTVMDVGANISSHGPMSMTKRETFQAAEQADNSLWPEVRLSETDRLEAFTDAVLSITMTLLVVEIVRPDFAPGQLLGRLAAQWTSYIAFLASFSYAGVIWLNHRAVFARVRYCDRSLHLANLLLLLPSALIPFPTAILSTAIQAGNAHDAKVAVLLYAAIAGAMCLAWLVLFHVLSVRPYLLEDHVKPDFFPKERIRAVLGASFSTPSPALPGSGCQHWRYSSSWHCRSSMASPARDLRKRG